MFITAFVPLNVDISSHELFKSLHCTWRTKSLVLFYRDCPDPQNSQNDKNQNCTLRFDKKPASAEFCQPLNQSGGQMHGWILLKINLYYNSF